MKKFLLLTFFVCTLLVLDNATSKANPSIQSSTFDFPTEIILGDTIDISMYVDLVGIDSAFVGSPVSISILLVDSDDTVAFCEGTVEIQLPGTLMYTFSCAIPDSTGLGEHNLVIIIHTSFGEFVIEGGHPLKILGDHDLNQDGRLNVSDLIILVNYMFNDGSSPLPSASNADFNCDQILNVSDLVFQVAYMFKDGSLPCMGTSGL